MFVLPVLIGFLGGVFEAATGWSFSTVTSGVLDWVVRGVVSMITAIWQFIDATAEPDLSADWFSGGATSPMATAFVIGFVVLAVTFMLAIIRGVMVGSPGALLRLVGVDLPGAILMMISVVAIGDVLLNWADQTSDWVWEHTRENTIEALDQLAGVMMSRLGPLGILGPIVGMLTQISMLVLWIVLLVRSALIPLVVVFAVAFVFPATLLPGMRDNAKSAGQMLLALIISKPLITIALTVGFGALGSSGDVEPIVATGVVELAPEASVPTPTQPAALMSGFSSALAAPAPAAVPTGGVPTEVSSKGIAATLSVLFVGIVTVGLAAFMPFMIWKLVPMAAGAAVAQGVASGPMRASSQAAQFSYYGSSIKQRLGSKASGQSAAAAGGKGAGAAAASGASSGAAAGGAAAGGAAVAAGPAAPIVAAAAVGKAAVGAVKSTAQQSAAAHTGGSSASSGSPGGTSMKGDK